MAKSGRRKKQDRAKAEARRAEHSRRRARAERRRQQHEHFQQLLDPRTRPAEVAALVAAEMDDSLVAGTVVRLRLDAGAPAGELTEAARLLLASAPEPSLGTLAFAASAAHIAGDEEGELRHTSELLARAEAEDYDWLRLEVIRLISVIGHPGEAIELIEPHMRDAPDDEQAAEIYATSLERAFEDAEPGERERVALRRFADRSGLAGLRQAIGGFLERTTWGEVVRARVAEALAEVADEDWPAADRAAFTALAAEVALGCDDSDDDDMGVDELIERDRRDGPPETALTAFAADPTVAPELASRAAAWAKHVHYGLWQLADPVAQPGVWSTDLVSGVRRYVEFPAVTLEGAPPWTVWLGAVGPVDGIWRGTGTGVRLSPAEGDALAEYLDQAVSAIVQAMLGVPRQEIPEPEPIPFGRAGSRGVRWDFEEPPGEEYTRFSSTVTAALVTKLAAEVARYRATPPRLTNSDGDPMLAIEATISVTGDVTERLLAHPDFSREEDDEDSARILWWGEQVPAAQRDMLLAEVRARGLEPDDEDDDEPRRWIRGYLTPGDGVLRVSVNSQERLTRLIRILTRLGARPEVTAESRVDPAQDLAWGSGRPGVGAAPAAEGWEKWWLDEQVPALGDHTPREAVACDVHMIWLESLLRRFEYEAGLAVAQGEQGFDTAWLRAELGMPGLARD